MAERQINNDLFFNPNVDNLRELSDGLEQLRREGLRVNFMQAVQSYGQMLREDNQSFFAQVNDRIGNIL